MATAIHSRHLLSLDLEDQAKDAAGQLAASEKADELGLYTDPDIIGECLDLYIAGDAATIATFVESLHERGIYINWVTPETDEENELLTERLFGLTGIDRTNYHSSYHA